MSAVVGHAMGRITTLRRLPAPGEVGCVGACPLCSVRDGRAATPCLACRDELRARLDDMQLAWYVERAVN